MATVAVLAAAAALASCGDETESTNGSDSAKDASGDAETVVRRYYAALADGDGATVCGLMTTTAREGMKQLPAGERPKSCERAVAVLARDSIAVRKVELRDLAVAEPNATARVTSKDPPYDSGVLLRREGGSWKIAYPPGLLSRFDTPPGIRPHEDEQSDDEHGKRG
jgi:hypothetical protein